MYKFTLFQRILLASVLCLAVASLAAGQPATPSALDANTAPALHHGGFGLGTWNSTAEFKNIVVTSNGVVLYRSDFTKENGSGWSVLRGAWNVKDGVLQQSSIRTQCRAFFGDVKWANYTITLRARRTGGEEGFCVFFNCLDANNWADFNVGGWTNSLAGVQYQTDGGGWGDLSERVPLTVESNVWYDVKVVLNGDRAECYLNSKLILTANYSNPPSATAQSGAGAVPKMKRPFPLFKPASHGTAGVGTWNTTVDFSNIVVTRGNVVLYRSDFKKAGLNTWLTSGGSWTTTNGVLRQSQLEYNGYATTGDPNWTNYTITLQARKIAGEEGFRVVVGWLDDDNCIWFDAGSSRNTTGLIEETIRGQDVPLSGTTPLTIESNVWYNVKVVMSGVQISCYINSNLVQTASAETIFTTNAMYLGASSVPDGNILKFRVGNQVITGSLTKERGWPGQLEPGSLVQVTGEIEPGGQGGPTLDDQCDLEILSPDDVVLLQAPSWWTWQRFFAVGAAFATVLATASCWIAMISRKNRLLTAAQRQLKCANDELEARVRDRTADLAKANVELKYEQSLFRTLLDTSSDYIYFKDIESRFVRCSVSLCKRSGLTPEQIKGKTDFNIFREEHARRSVEDEQKIMRTNQPLIGELEKEMHPDGRVTWALTTKMPWHDADGKVIGTFGISRDITSIKEAEVELERAHKQLVEASHASGMAEVATGVLHNVGNVLNSVNVSATLLTERLRQSKVNLVARLSALFKDHAADLGDFITKDPQGRQVPAFLNDLSEQLGREQAQALEELASLQKNVGHIKEIVTMQQNYATVYGVSMIVNVSELIEDALRLTDASLKRHGIRLVKEIDKHLPDIAVDHHKVLQILINLIRNAKDACKDSQRSERQLTLRATALDGQIHLSVIDNGVGIPPENLTRIFAHGFTTRKNGHGFGLHSSALAAKEIGGQLLVHSEGPGKGAAFTLKINLTPKAVRSAPAMAEA